MATWVWLLIAIAAVVVFFAFRSAKARNSVDDPEGTQGVATGNEPIANAGTDGQDRASSVLRPLPDTQTGQPTAFDNASTDSQSRPTSLLRPLADSQLDPDRRAALSSDPGMGGQQYAQLLEDHELQSILGQWKDIQAAFVDEPRKAIQDADALVAELMQRLAETFASEREQLESQWAGGRDVSTEDLRRGLRRYRSFFERLLAAGPGPRSRASVE